MILHTIFEALAYAATVAYYLRDLPRLSRWWTSAQAVTA